MHVSVNIYFFVLTNNNSNSHTRSRYSLVDIEQYKTTISYWLRLAGMMDDLPGFETYWDRLLWIPKPLYFKRTMGICHKNNRGSNENLIYFQINWYDVTPPAKRKKIIWSLKQNVYWETFVRIWIYYETRWYCCIFEGYIRLTSLLSVLQGVRWTEKKCCGLLGSFINVSQCADLVCWCIVEENYISKRAATHGQMVHVLLWVRHRS